MLCLGLGYLVRDACLGLPCARRQLHDKVDGLERRLFEQALDRVALALDAHAREPEPRGDGEGVTTEVLHLAALEHRNGRWLHVRCLDEGEGIRPEQLSVFLGHVLPICPPRCVTPVSHMLKTGAPVYDENSIEGCGVLSLCPWLVVWWPRGG